MALRKSTFCLAVAVLFASTLAAPPTLDIGISAAWAAPGKGKGGEKSRGGGRDKGGATTTSGGEPSTDAGSANTGSVSTETSTDEQSAPAVSEPSTTASVSQPPADAAQEDNDQRNRNSFFHGLDAYQRGDYRIAMVHWLPLAREGNAAAQAGLGAIFYNTGLNRGAYYWSRLAALQGETDAATCSTMPGVMAIRWSQRR